MIQMIKNIAYERTREIYTVVVLAFFGSILLFGVIVPQLNSIEFTNSNGIYAHNSGHAVYIQGESCTINSEAHISIIEFQEMYIWCSTKHMEFLGEKQ